MSLISVCQNVAEEVHCVYTGSISPFFNLALIVFVVSVLVRFLFPK